MSHGIPHSMKFRLKEFRDQAGLTQEQMAERLDISVSLYNGLETGKRRMNATYLQGASEIFGVPASELIVEAPIVIPIAGRVGAGASVPLYDTTDDGGLFKVAAPPQVRKLGPAGSFAAVEVEGDSMMPMYQPGDILFFRRATHEGIPDEDIGRPCIVEDADGHAWVKQVRTGDEPDLFHLTSLNPTAQTRHNQRIKWATRVMLALPAEMVERL